MTSASNFSGPTTTPLPAGDGQGPLPDLMVNPLDTEAAHHLKESAQKFKALAEGGGFAVNEAGFEAYNKVCNEFIDGYETQRRELIFLTTRATMGSSKYAQEVADFNVKVADGDESSLIPNLELLKESILQVQEALKIARNNYRAGDSEHAQTLSRMHGNNQ